MLTHRYRQAENDETGNNHRRPDRYIVLRNILNLIFMLGAICGVLVFYWGDSRIGTIVILVSMLFKFVECVFRFIK